jgi:ribosome-binding ATPase YchF (GTP1/OBG family)
MVQRGTKNRFVVRQLRLIDLDEDGYDERKARINANYDEAMRSASGEEDEEDLESDAENDREDSLRALKAEYYRTDLYNIFYDNYDEIRKFDKVFANLLPDDPFYLSVEEERDESDEFPDDHRGHDAYYAKDYI